MFLVHYDYLDGDQIDTGFTGAPDRFVAEGDIVQQEFVTYGPHIYENELEQWGRPVQHFQTQRLTGHRDSTVRSLAVNLGSGFARTQVESVLKGEGSFSEMLGLYIADADQHFAQRTLQSHNAPHATSDLLYKGALKERSRSEYSGLIKVMQGAQGTDAYQANRNLVLSEDALARSIPQLEIEANEVRCTHGATVSPVEEEHLFYLMSRGIDRVTAQKLVVFGFFGDVLDRIRLPTVREGLSRAKTFASGDDDLALMEEARLGYDETVPAEQRGILPQRGPAACADDGFE
jgi:Fe-S cluster assembly protein SufD